MTTEIIVQDAASQQDARRLRGLEIAATSRLVERDGVWIVPSQSSPKSYHVRLEDQRCDCPDYESRNQPCKHVFAAEFVYKRETQTAP